MGCGMGYIPCEDSMLKSFQSHLAFFRLSALLMVLSLACTAAFIPETAAKGGFGESAPLRSDLRVSHGSVE